VAAPVSTADDWQARVDELDSGAPAAIRPDEVIDGRPRCVVCTKVIDATGPGSQWRKYCDEHRGMATTRARKAPAGRAARGRPRSRTAERLGAAPPRADTPRQRVAQAGGKVSDSAATATLSKLLLILCVILIHYRMKGAGIADPTGEAAESLAPTNSEAADMVRPLARWGNASPLGSRVIAPIVRNEDIVLSVYAWWDWNRRVNRWFDANRGGRMRPFQPRVVDGTVGEQRAGDQVIVPDEPISPPEVRYDPAAPPPAGQMPW